MQPDGSRSRIGARNRDLLVSPAFERVPDNTIESRPELRSIGQHGGTPVGRTLAPLNHRWGDRHVPYRPGDRSSCGHVFRRADNRADCVAGPLRLSSGGDQSEQFPLEHLSQETRHRHKAGDGAGHHGQIEQVEYQRSNGTRAVSRSGFGTRGIAREQREKLQIQHQRPHRMVAAGSAREWESVSAGRPASSRSVRRLCFSPKKARHASDR